MRNVKYLAEAELFSVGSWKSCGQHVRYRRFALAAEAIRFAIEELGREHLAGVYLEVDDERFDSAGIRRLYDSTDYPLARRPAGALA
jgi:hypothetical protein